MANLTPQQRIALIAAYFDPSQWADAFATSYAENVPGDPAVNNQGHVGLFQIAPSTAAGVGFPNADLTDPAVNTQVAAALYRAHGWQQDWSLTHNDQNPLFRQGYQQGQQLASWLRSTGVTDWHYAAPLSPENLLNNPQGFAGSAASDAGNAVSAALGPIGAVLQQGLWVLAGIALAAIGLFVLTNPGGQIGEAIRTARENPEMAAA